MSKRAKCKPDASTSRRRNLLAQIHLGAKRLGLSEDQYRGWLEQSTGKRSCRDLNDKQLAHLAAALRKHGAADGGQRGGTSIDRPTDKQWDKLAAMSRRMGWNGLEDSRLATFVKRVVKVEAPRFLTRQQMSHVLVGLERWMAYRREHPQAQAK